MAAAAATGAWWHGPIPLVVGLGLVTGALALRRPALLAIGAFALAAALGVRAHDGLEPLSTERYEGPMTLVTDPDETPFGMRADARVGTKRVEVDATDGAAGALADALAGERLEVAGTLGPPPPDAPWLKARHVVGILRVDRAERLDGGAAPWRAANRFRRVLDRGAEVLPGDARVLYGGIVLGDRRGQSPELVDDFRGSGLTHLLVVSGQNVAFVLTLASPLLRRLPTFPRWVATLAVIAFFAVLTRFEPSILRASVMAAIAVTGILAGRPMGSTRALSLAVAVLVVVDPLLVWSVAFQLSVAATTGIALLGQRLSGLLWGPRWFRDVLGITLAAQLGVSPVLIPRFGGLPVVSVLANVLAVPAQGLVTIWGLPAGVVAGLAPPGVAAVVHLPTSVLVGWVAAVARGASRLPLGELRTGELVVASAGGWAALVLARHRPSWRVVRWAAVAIAVAALAAPAWALRSPSGHVELAEGVHLHRGGGVTVLVLDERRSPRVLLEGLRRAGVRRIDLVVGATEPADDVLGALRHRWPVDRVIAGGDDAGPIAVHVGELVVTAVPGEPTEVRHVPP